jgi:hypothetical protein
VCNSGLAARNQAALEAAAQAIASAPPGSEHIAYSWDQRTVTIQAGHGTMTIERPEVIPWHYRIQHEIYWVAHGGSLRPDGSSDHPFGTIPQALDQAGPGDIVYIRPGTYVENIHINKSGLRGKPIIVSAAPGALGKVTVTPSKPYVAGHPHGAVVSFDGADFVWVNGLNIEGPLGRHEAPKHEHFSADGITFENGAGYGDRVTNNVIYDNVHSGIKELNHDGRGIYIAGNIIFHNGTTDLDHGIYMPGDNVTMTANVIFNNAGFGIHSYSAPRGQVITHNLIFSNHSGGIILAGADNHVSYNLLVNNPSGVLLFRAGCENNIIQNNTMAYNNTNLAIDSGGGRLGNPTGNRVRGNRTYQVAATARESRRERELFAGLSFLEASSLDFQFTPGARWW